MILLSFPASAIAQRATASVSGVVTADGKPVAGAPVWAAREQTGSDAQASTETDAEGRYRLEGMPAGRYVVCAFKAGYRQPIDRIQSLREQFGRSITLAEGETAEAFDISMVRGGIITGRVVDTRGRPIVNSSIRLEMRVEGGLAIYIPLPIPDFLRTDDRGIYRAYGLVPGQYLVSVADVAQDPSFAKTYFPATPQPKEAQAVSILGTEEVRDVDIVVTMLPSEDRFAVSGRVVDAESGTPLEGVTVSLVRKAEDRLTAPGFETDSAKTPATGEFRVERVPAGTYKAIATRSCGPDCDYIAGTAQVAVSADTPGVVLSVQRGSTVEGRVVLDGVDDPTIAKRINELHITTYLADSDPDDLSMSGFFDSRREARVAADGTFRLLALGAGVHDVHLYGRDGQKGFRLLSVEGGGSPTPDTIAVEEGRDRTNVRIVVAYGTGTIRGRVRFVNGAPPPGARIAVTVDRDDPKIAERLVADTRSEFAASGLLPGTYRVSARASGVAAAVQSVTVPDRGSVDVTLTIDLGKSPPAEDNDEDGTP